MDYYFIAYVFLCIVVGLFGFTTLNNSGRMWSAILVLILFILIFIFYGLRWFTGTTSVFSYKGSWPPIINMCPDYLVYYKNGATDTCIDLVGVNNSAGRLQAWSKEELNNPPQAADKYFNYVYKPGMKPDELTTLCKQAQEAGLTWEGITNGESCTFKVSVA
jgi:hypothetical protein